MRSSALEPPRGSRLNWFFPVSGLSGDVYFDSGKLEDDTEYDLTATGSEPDEFTGSVDVKVVEVSRTKGQFGDQLVGIVENPTDAEVGGPIDVLVACFDKAGELLTTTSTSSRVTHCLRGGTGSFSVDLFDDPCENWAIGSSGYNFRPQTHGNLG